MQPGAADHQEEEKMKSPMTVACVLVIVPVLFAGCGSRLVGEYQAEVRLIEGKQESDSPGYTLAAVREKLAAEPRSLVLLSNGRYILRSGDATNEGTWRVEEDTLILHDDTSNGEAIVSALQMERKWPIRPNGEIVRAGSYTHYNLEEVYVRR